MYLDHIFSLAYGLNAAALLDNTNAEKFFKRIEDLVGQADEVDGKYLHVSFITLFFDYSNEALDMELYEKKT